MGNLLNQFLAQRKIMGWHKKARTFVRKPNGLYDEKYFEIKDNVLIVYPKEKDFLDNPKIEGIGSPNSSTYQRTYVWQEGETTAFPLFQRRTIPRIEDEDDLKMRAFNLGVMFKTKQMEHKLGGMEVIPIPAQWLQLALLAGVLVMSWQILGALG